MTSGPTGTPQRTRRISPTTFLLSFLIATSAVGIGLWRAREANATHNQSLHRQVTERSRKAFGGQRFAEDMQTTDWQALDMGSGEYGPPLRGSVRLGVGELANAAEYTSGVIAGFVWKDKDDPRTISATYRDARFHDDGTCIYLQSVRQGTTDSYGWQWGTAAAPSDAECPSPAAVGRWIADSIYSERVVKPGTNPTEYYAPGDYPNAMRFEEHRTADRTSSRRIVTAFRCADAVCHLGITDTSELEGREHVGARGEVVSAQSRIALYYDDQVLALPKQGGGLKKNGPRASLIPEDGIELWKEDSGDFDRTDDNPYGKLIARAYVSSVPGGPYAKFMRQGWTGVFLSKGFFRWQLTASAIDANGRPIGKGVKVYMDKTKWDLDVDNERRGFGTVRWAWLKDEGVWLPCDVGCCEASIN